MGNCHICGKKISFLETEWEKNDFTLPPLGMTDNDILCNKCGKDHKKQTTKKLKISLTPVKIIGIAVICSVSSVFGVLLGWELYQNYETERGLAFGIDVEKVHQDHIRDIENCVPNNVQCYNSVVSSFNSYFDGLSNKHGFDVNESNVKKYRQLALNFLKIEYDYQNEIYNINQEYSNYEPYSHSPQLDSIAQEWQQRYKAMKNP